MTYPLQQNDDIADDILKYKEFDQYAYQPSRERKVYDDPLDNKYLRPQSHQKFVENLINPDTLYTRFLVNQSTGSGKTLIITLSALRFIKVYKQWYSLFVSNAPPTDKRRTAVLADKKTPSVFIIGFKPTETAVYRDLMKYPEFGFITHSEKRELDRLRRIAAGSNSPDDWKRAKEAFGEIKARITNKTKGGFFKFLGYQKLVNTLFLSDDLDLAAVEKESLRLGKPLDVMVGELITEGKIRINTIFLESMRHSCIFADEIHNSYNMVQKNNYGIALQYILDYLKADVTFVALTATVINSSPTEIVEMINYLNNYDASGGATPTKIKKSDLFNGYVLKQGAQERIQDLLRGKVSYFQDINPKYFPRKEFVGKEINLPMGLEMKTIPYFKFIECPMSELHQSTLLDLANKTLADIRSKGEVSKREILNEATIDQTDVKAAEENTDEAVLDEPTPDNKRRAKNREYQIEQGEEDVVDIDEQISEHDIVDNYPIKVPTDGYTIFDMVYPNPRSSTVGIYRSSDVRKVLALADATWKDKHEIAATRVTTGYKITGKFLERRNLGKYSSKYMKLLRRLDKIYDRCKDSIKIGSRGDKSSDKNSDKKGSNDEVDGGIENKEVKTTGDKDPKSIDDTEIDPNAAVSAGEKIFIYHNRVRMSGTLEINEILLLDGYLDEYSEPTLTTRCAICGIRMQEHEALCVKERLLPHRFYAARFVLISSEIKRELIDISMFKFNHPENAFGTNYKIIIGSKIVREGYEFKAVRHHMMMSLPVSIPAFIQILGRTNRKNSHIDLPPDKRNIALYIYISTINKELKSATPLASLNITISPEETYIVSKIRRYFNIQLVEKAIGLSAIDAIAHRDIVMPPELLQEYFNDPSITSTIYQTDRTPAYRLGMLYYNVPVMPREFTLNQLRQYSYKAFGYNEQEIRLQMFVIKRLFQSVRSVWSYDDLFAAVKNPPFNLEENTSLFSENNFILSLDNFVSSNRPLITDNVEASVVSNADDLAVIRLLDSNNRQIYIGNTPHKIEHIGDKYIALPEIMVSSISDRIADTYREAPTNHNHNHSGSGIGSGGRDEGNSKRGSADRTTDKSSSHKTVKDFESFVRPHSIDKTYLINIDKLVEENQEYEQFIEERGELLAKYGEDESLINNFDAAEFLTNYSEVFYRYFLEEIIMHAVKVCGVGVRATSTSHRGGPSFTLHSASANTRLMFPDAKLRKINSELMNKIYQQVIRVFDKMGVILRLRDIIKYRDVISKLSGKHIVKLSMVAGKVKGEPLVPLQTPIGFITRSAVRIYDPPNWIEVTKIALNVRTQYNENSTVIGFLEKNDQGGTVFKLRHPISMIKQRASRDIRTIERGTACESKHKKSLEDIAEDLGIKFKDVEGVKIKSLCESILRKLVGNEIKERAKDSKLKWFYWWHDNVPDVKTIWE
jgi:hypothetical protein